MAVIGNSVADAVQWLQQSVVALPTETVYGLAGNALDPLRVAQIFEAKQRPYFDPLILHIHQLEQLHDLITAFPEPLKQLADAFWPGPLTLLLPRTNHVPDLTCSGLSHAAFRMPSHPLTLQVLQEFGKPLAAPSANPFGYVSPTTAQHVQQQLGSRIPYILDGGPCTIGLESTIVGLSGDQVTVYRLGGLAIEAIEQLVGPVVLHINESSDPRAPGQLLSHYAPRKPLFTGDIDLLLEQYRDQQPLILRYQHLQPNYPSHLQWIMSPDGSETTAAARLFDLLRQADAHSAPLILAEAAPSMGLGRAINDRLKRAAFRG